MIQNMRAQGLLLFGTILFLLVFVPGCEDVDEFTPLDRENGERPIIGGSTSVGAEWNGVGALTIAFPGSGYGGSFCTGTLIDSRWVLTAAHCLSPNDAFTPTPAYVKFYIGNDARPVGYYKTPPGSFYQVGKFHIHPNYKNISTQQYSDIALVYLSDAVPISVPRYTINQTDLSSLAPKSAFYVGFGVSSVTHQNTGGVKRSATIPLQSIGAMSYANSSYSGAVCFGDSGGPGFYDSGSGPRVIGVNSTTNGENCGGGSTQIRVDRYAQWIAGIMGDDPPSCKDISSLCLCSKACQSNGMCNNAACETMGCSELYNCMTGCAMDTSCQDECYFGGTSAAKQAFDAMMLCFYENCEGYSDNAQYISCVKKNCSSRTTSCFKPTNCDLLGGDCPSNEACSPILLIGKNTCLSSNGKSLGDDCDPTLQNSNDCADGMYCAGYFGAGNCYNTCRTVTHCEKGEICNKLFDFADEPRVCVESGADTDADSDTDSDTDLDVDSDADSGGDVDTDVDADGDTDVDVDGDSDSDADTDQNGVDDQIFERSDSNSDCGCRAPGAATIDSNFPKSFFKLLFRLR